MYSIIWELKPLSNSLGLIKILKPIGCCLICLVLNPWCYILLLIFFIYNNHSPPLKVYKYSILCLVQPRTPKPSKINLSSSSLSSSQANKKIKNFYFTQSFWHIHHKLLQLLIIITVYTPLYYTDSR